MSCNKQLTLSSRNSYNKDEKTNLKNFVSFTITYKQLLNIFNIYQFFFKLSIYFTAYTKGKVDSQICGHDDVRSPVHWHTVRCIRVWTSPKTPTTSPSNDVMVAMRCFTPHQITTRGCCGARKPIFESLTTLWDRARNWIELSG